MKKLELRKLIKEELLKEDKSMPEEIKNKILDIFALKLKIPEIDDTKFHEVYNKDIDISQMSIITPLFNKLNLRISVAKEFIPKNKKWKQTTKKALMGFGYDIEYYTKISGKELNKWLNKEHFGINKDDFVVDKKYINNPLEYYGYIEKE